MKTAKEIKEKFEKLVEEETKSFDIMMGKLKENFYHFAPWNVEPTFKSTVRKSFAEEIVMLCHNHPETTKERIIELYTGRVMKTQIMSRGSNQMHNLTSLWEKEVAVEIIEKIKWDF